METIDLTMTEKIILVDARNQMTGTMEKMAVHRAGLLHRAFSIFLMNTKGELLLQQRAIGKYHSGGLWTNTCCGHPRPGETILDAGKRRLKEETGLVCELKEVFSFTYRHVFVNGLTEHEFDHVLFGISDAVPCPDPLEIMETKYLTPDLLAGQLLQQPEAYTSWLSICFSKICSILEDEFKMS